MPDPCEWSATAEPRSLFPELEKGAALRREFERLCRRVDVAERGVRELGELRRRACHVGFALGLDNPFLVRRLHLSRGGVSRCRRAWELDHDRPDLRLEGAVSWSHLEEIVAEHDAKERDRLIAEVIDQDLTLQALRRLRRALRTNEPSPGDLDRGWVEQELRRAPEPVKRWAAAAPHEAQTWLSGLVRRQQGRARRPRGGAAAPPEMKERTGT